jgi:hypothetical protein
MSADLTGFAFLGAFVGVCVPASDVFDVARRNTRRVCVGATAVVAAAGLRARAAALPGVLASMFYSGFDQLL